jgi:hypothetical protein
MGFFSWKTQDTHESIPSHYSSRPTFPVTLTDHKGNKYHEPRYEGYGVFGGKDYYELVAEMNGKAVGDLDKDRWIGIKLEHGVSAIKHKETGQVYQSGGEDFFNWDSDILPHGLSGNASIESGEWDSINIKEEGVLLPNLTENENWIWRNEGAENCPDQGYFYCEEYEDDY